MTIAHLLVLPLFTGSVIVLSQPGLFPFRKWRTRKFGLSASLQKHLIDVLGGSATIQFVEVIALDRPRYVKHWRAGLATSLLLKLLLQEEDVFSILVDLKRKGKRICCDIF